MNFVMAALVIIVSLVGAAFFAGAETALTAASRARLQALETSGDGRAALVIRLIANKGRLIGAMLLGGQFVTISSSAYATSIFVRAFGEGGVLEATAMMTVLIVVFGEVLPKTVAIAYPDRVALAIAPLVSLFVTIFGPVVHAVEAFVRLILKTYGFALDERDPGLTGAEELRGAVDVLHRDGEVARDQRDMFGGVLELEDVPVGDVMIGSVMTGAPGSAAAVTNSGSTSAAVLNFTIPAGATGAAGSGSGSGSGSAGTSGVTYASVQHSVTFGTVYYPVNAAVGSSSESTAILTWVPGGCTATKLSVYSLQGNPITVSLRSGMPGAMSSAGLACSASNATSCTQQGSVTITAGSFIDLSITGSNGTAAPVWTALACN